MARLKTMLALMFLGVFAAASAQAQTRPAYLPTPASPTVAEIAPGVIPDSPLAAALADVQPGPLPPPATAPANLPGPYFEHDRLLDPAELPQPGWLGEIQAIAANPHVRYWSRINGSVEIPGIGTRNVSVPGAHLAWAASPSVLLGYRLPAGFGEFTVGYREMASAGTKRCPVPMVLRVCAAGSI